MEKQAKADKPFFLWYNSTAMHFRSHVAAKNIGKSGQDPYSDRMVTHDEQIGQMLNKLDELGIADNTIVMYSTDNGPQNDTWPDAGNTPFRSNKDTNWEGGWRVPCLMRWPGKIKAGTWLNGVCSHIDMFPTLLAAAGNPDVTKQLLDGCTVGGKTFKVHLDGYNMIPYLTGEVKESPRKFLMYFSDDGEVMAVRIGDYKLRAGRAARNFDECLAGTAGEASDTEDLQPPSRPVRAGRLQLECLLGLDGRSHFHAVRDASGGGGADRGLRQVPAAPEAGFVQPGRGAGAGGPPQLSRPSYSTAAKRARCRRAPRKRIGISPKHVYDRKGRKGKRQYLSELGVLRALAGGISASVVLHASKSCASHELCAGAARPERGVLINRTHAYRDLIMPIDSTEKRLFDAIDQNGGGY